MTDEDPKTPAPKGAKKMDRPEPPMEVPAPLVSFGEFVQLAGLSAKRVGGFQVHLLGTTGLASRPLAEWQAAMTHYQAQA